MHRIRADEDGDLVRSCEFLKNIFKLGIAIETSGGCKSTLNSKVEHLMRDNHKSTHIELTMSGLPFDLWCFQGNMKLILGVDHIILVLVTHLISFGMERRLMPGVVLDSSSKLIPHGAKV